MRKLCLVLGMMWLASMPLASAAAREPKTWVVGMGGNDRSGSGSFTAPLASIQTAIDRAEDGDTVLVLAGNYRAGLNFRGKAITVRGSSAEEVTLEANEEGWIARFEQGEGPDSILEDFTLLPDPQALGPRGLPEMIQLSANAKPKTRELKLAASAGGGSQAQEALIQAAAQAAPGETMAFDGRDPFHQPAATTYYYGSGDVNLDGQLSKADVTAVQSIANGKQPAQPQADVDGNLTVDAADVALVKQALAGGTLPGWWNRLETREQRNAWIDRALAIDPTDQHPYTSWFLCYDFAVQTYANFSFTRADLFDTVYSGGQTLFNLPVYMVGVYAPGFGHEINAILVGDDPLNFNDWRFIEPQTDETVVPGNWDMPYGAQLDIHAQGQVASNHATITQRVMFQVEQGGVTLLQSSPDLLTTRSAPSVRTPDNQIDLWNPHLLPAGNGSRLLYERQREDLSRVTDLHLDSRSPAGIPLTLDGRFSRLLDWTQGGDGQIHLLWKGKPGDNPGIYSGVLDITQGKITNPTPVANAIIPREGRIVVRPNGEVLAIWYEYTATRDDPSRGIYWSRLGAGGWEPKQKLTTDFPWIDGDWPGWVRRDFVRYLFDAVAEPDGQVTLVWLEQVDEFNQAILEMRYDGISWGQATTLDTTNARGLALAVGTDGILHLVYWTGKMQDQYDEEGRGGLMLRTRTGGTWTEAAPVDPGSSGDCCVDLAAGESGDIYMAWERRVGDQVVPIWQRYHGGVWEPEQALPVPVGSDAWYPAVTILKGGRGMAAWSLRSPEHITVETVKIGGK